MRATHLPARFPVLVVSGLLVAIATTAAADLEQGFSQPPPEARLRAYWWWLNGNVTKASITRDLEEMKATGFGGALICDADGSSQQGNARVPHGPDFFSAEWRELYKHALREADRLGLDMSLNIQSGWNLGGPMVKPEDAPKKLTWSETRVTGGQNVSLKLPAPKARDNFYRDLFVLACPHHPSVSSQPNGASVSASSTQPNHDAKLAVDDNPATYWVSAGARAGTGPSPGNPQWLQLDFPSPETVAGLLLIPRSGYGPTSCELQASDNGRDFHTVRSFQAKIGQETKVTFSAASGRSFRLLFTGALDPLSPDSPRNVQVAELKLLGKDGLTLGSAASRRPLQNQLEKALLRPLRPFSAPDSAPLFQEYPATPGEADARAAEVLDLTDQFAPDGTLNWNAPAGEWRILRFGFTLNDSCRVSTCSQGWDGYALDPFDAGAFRRYWDAVVEPLIADAGPLAGKALKYLHTDSWEVEVANWTPTLREEFRQRRGYDLLPWLPVIAGDIVNSRDESDRFLNDFRKTIGDLAIDNHYRLFKEGAHKHGLLIHPESGGPHGVPIDAQRCLGFNDAPMSEFWAWSWRHRVGDENRFFVKQPASAAHTYGRKLVLAEGFTTIGPHWQETLWDNLKPSFDKAIGEGLNLLVWHAFVCSPESEGMPGQQYFAGTHLNPNVTWWSRSTPFFDYINRCQFLQQQGLFVADVAYYYGDHVPNFAQLKRSDPAKILPGYDYDVVTAEVLLTRMSVKDGRLVLPDGMSYRVLVLRDLGMLSPAVLRKLQEFVAAGATIIGARPVSTGTLTGGPGSDAEFQQGVAELWSGSAALKGRVITAKTARDVLLEDGVLPDFEFALRPGDSSKPEVDYIHRRDGEAEIYFVANRSTNALNADCTFRVAGKAPELWNAVTGERRFAAAYQQAGGRTTLPLAFPPCGSWFVVFQHPSANHPATRASNAPQLSPTLTLDGPWQVRFDPAWGGPEAAQFDELVSWTLRPEAGIKFYSGTATYLKTFNWNPGAQNQKADVWLDLGNLRELAEARVNGKSCGIVWAPPFRLNISTALKPGANTLEVDVVNFWPNRIIGDAGLPADERRTKTNIRGLTNSAALMPSGLFGPVTLQVGEREDR